MSKIRYVFPNAFTSMNFLLGVFSICWVTGTFATKDPILMGAYFIILCVLLDKLDGFAARLVNASSEFGAQFDSLADLIAFGLAPAFCILMAAVATVIHAFGDCPLRSPAVLTLFFVSLAAVDGFLPKIQEN